jgi:regulator of protease activity HflC (stomatin/prohibitin superfamily)
VFDKLIDLIVQFIHLFQFFFVIRCYERAIVLRFGKMHRLANPGLHWKFPFNIEVYLSANVVPETMIIGPQSLTTKDGVSIVISSVVTFCIEDVQKFLLEVEGAHQVIEDSAVGIVSHFIVERTWGQLGDTDVGNELTKAVRRQAKRYGVEIINVQISDFTRSRSFRLMQQFNHHSHHANES